MEDQIKELIKKLEAALPLIPKVDDLASAKAGLDADLKASQDELARLGAKISDVNSKFTSAQLLAQKEHDAAIYAKQQELKSVSARVVDATSKLADLSAQVASKQSLHAQLDASIENLRKKFA